MTDDYKALGKQIETLANRLAAVEHSLKQIPSVYNNKTDADSASPRYCMMPQVQERALATDVSPERMRLIRDIEKKWVNGTRLRYYFFNNGPWAGPEAQKSIVRQGFDVWKNAPIGLTFAETSNMSEAEIRIGFLNGDGAWSYVGRDVLSVPGKHERTMNFGWDLTQDPRGVDVPVHEIGHTLGFPHEHQNPFSGIVWDEDAVYSYFSGPPNNWSRATTEFNILRKLSNTSVDGSEWDPNSVMHYAFAAGLIKQPAQYQGGINPAGGLSQRDLAQVRRFYPPAQTNIQRLEAFRSQMLSLAPAQQKDFLIEPGESRNYTIQTFGKSDTLMVLFEEQNGEQTFVNGDDDSGSDRNARITEWLHAGRKYVLRIRLYLNYASGDTAVLMW